MSTKWSDSSPCPSCGKGWDAGLKRKCMNCHTLQCHLCCDDSNGIGMLGKITWCKICCKETETAEL